MIIKQVKTIILTLCICLSYVDSSHAKEWYEGGNLHDKNMWQWKQATTDNKRATCADFVSYMASNRLFKAKLMILFDKNYGATLYAISNEMIDCLDYSIVSLKQKFLISQKIESYIKLCYLNMNMLN